MGGRNEKTYSLLRQLPSTLVLAVTEEFDDTTLVWGKSIMNEANQPIGFPLAVNDPGV